MNMSFVGLRKIGPLLGGVLRRQGTSRRGVDSSAEHMEALVSGRCPVDETGLPTLLDGCRACMEFTRATGMPCSSDIT